MSLPSRFALLAALMTMSACSSSAGVPPGTPDAGADGGGVTTPDASGAGADRAATIAPDAPVDSPFAATDAQSVKASMACTKFCECMAKNCADKIFPGGCLSECASQTRWDLPCRQNMCGLVPAQPNNDHCTHAMGLFQCLDKP